MGTLIQLQAADVQAVSELESYMRSQLSNLHFKRKVDLAYLNERLSSVRLQLQPAEDSGLPTLRSQTARAIDVFTQTLVFQFADFLGQTIDGQAPYAVNRCEAICKKRAVEDCRQFYEKFRSLEDSWKSEIVSDLEGQGLEEVERCADFFLAAAGAKFCSDSCRFNSFALRKQLKTPSYQAEKQRRYRERQKNTKGSEMSDN